MVVGGALGGKAGAGMGALTGITAGLGSKVYDLYDVNKKLQTENHEQGKGFGALADSYKTVSDNHAALIHSTVRDRQKLKLFGDYISTLKGKQTDIEALLADEPELVNAIKSLVDIQDNYK